MPKSVRKKRAVPQGLRLQYLQAEYASLGDRLRWAGALGAAPKALAGLQVRQKEVAREISRATRSLTDEQIALLRSRPRIFQVPADKQRFIPGYRFRPAPCAALSGVAPVLRQEGFAEGPGASVEVEPLQDSWVARFGCQIPATAGISTTGATMASTFCFEFPAASCRSRLAFDFAVHGGAFVRVAPLDSGMPRAEWGYGVKVYADAGDEFESGFPLWQLFVPAMDEVGGRFGVAENWNCNAPFVLSGRQIAGDFEVAADKPSRLFVVLYASVSAVSAGVEMHPGENFLALGGLATPDGGAGVEYLTTPLAGE